MMQETTKEGKTKRFTKQRQAILDTLKETKSHPDANWVYGKVIKKIPNISLGTVYRNLNILSEECLVNELTFQPGLSRYDADTKPHHHIMCIKCFKIDDIEFKTDCDVNSDLKQQLIKDLGYKDLNCEILFKGICKDCKEKE